MEITRREALKTAGVAAVGAAGLGGFGPAQQAARGELPPQTQTPPKEILRPGEVPDGGILNALAFRPDGMSLASAVSNRGIVIMDSDAREVMRLPRPVHHGAFLYPRHPVAFSPDGKTVAARGAEPGSIELWDLDTEECLGAAGPRTGWSASCLAFAPDGKLAAAGVPLPTASPASRQEAMARETREGFLWDPATGKELGRFALAPHQMVFLPPDGKSLAFIDAKGGVKIHDVATGEQRAELLTAAGCLVTALAVSRDGTTLASAELRHTSQPVQLAYYQVVLWDLATGKELAARFEPQTDYITALAFAPDGGWLISADLGWGGVVKSWHVGPRDEHQATRGPDVALFFSQEGQFTSCYSSRTAPFHRRNHS